MKLNTHVYVEPHQTFGADSVLNGQVGLVFEENINPHIKQPWSYVYFEYIYEGVVIKEYFWVEDKYLREATDEERATCPVQAFLS